MKRLFKIACGLLCVAPLAGLVGCTTGLVQPDANSVTTVTGGAAPSGGGTVNGRVASPNSLVTYSTGVLHYEFYCGAKQGVVVTFVPKDIERDVLDVELIMVPSGLKLVAGTRQPGDDREYGREWTIYMMPMSSKEAGGLTFAKGGLEQFKNLQFALGTDLYKMVRELQTEVVNECKTGNGSHGSVPKTRVGAYNVHMNFKNPTV